VSLSTKPGNRAEFEVPEESAHCFRAVQIELGFSWIGRSLPSVGATAVWRDGRPPALSVGIDGPAKTYRIAVGPFRVRGIGEVTVGAEGTWFFWRRFGASGIGVDVDLSSGG
jgi:hypothetical protein